MDDIERAIIYVFDESGATPPDLKKQAQAYCDEMKKLPNNWQLFLERVDITSYEGVRFWCLSALQEALRAQYAAMDANQQVAIKQKLTSWLRQPVTKSGMALASFLRNKVAQLVVYIVQVDYPKQWPTFFHEMVAMLSTGPQAVDMFCRILIAIDQDVVSLEIPRTSEEIQRSMALKDAMRDSCLKDILDACIQLVASLHSSNPELAANVLEAVAKYVNWIDINLVANDRFIPLLYGLLQAEQECLQAGAVEVLTEIVSKRMDAEAKLRLVQQLGLAPVAAAWKHGLPGAKDGELLLRSARLLAALCNEVLDSWKKVENAVVSISSVGLAVDKEALSDAQAAVFAAQSLLEEMFPAVLVTVRNEDEDVRLSVVPLLQSYANKLRSTVKRMGSMPEAHLRQIAPIFEAVAESVQYPGDAPAVEPNREPEKSEWEETEEILSERRQELFVLFKNVAKLSTEQTSAFLNSQLQLKMAAGTPFQEVEAAVTLLYEAGEGANEEMSKPGCGSLGRLAMALMQVDPPSASHRLVSLALMETYVRYQRVLAQNPQLLSRTLTFFLGDSGIGHPDEGVGARACYLFCRLVKAIRSSLRPHVTELLSALQPHLDRIATSPRPEPPAATKSPSGLASTTDDRLYAHEAAGLLVGTEDLPEAQQLACLAALMQPLLAQIEQNLPLVQSAGGGANERDTSELVSGMVLQALEGLNRLSRGLTLQLCTVKRPAVGECLAAPLQAALRIPRAAPSSKALRNRVISFLHRLVECLGVHLLPYLPNALMALLPPQTDRQELVDVFSLVNQLITRYKAALQPLLSSLLPEIVRRVHILLPATWDWTGSQALQSSSDSAGTAASSEEVREMAELQKSYFTLLHFACSNQLAGTVLQLEDATLDSVLKALMSSASAHTEPAMRRGCFQILKVLVVEVGNSQQALPGYHDFLLQLAGQVAIQSVITSGLDVRDTAVNSLLGDVAALLQLLSKQAGPALMEHLARNVLAALDLPHNLQEDLLEGVGATDPKGLKGTLRSLVQNAANAPLGSRGSARRTQAVKAGESVRGLSESNGMLM